VEFVPPTVQEEDEFSGDEEPPEEQVGAIDIEYYIFSCLWSDQPKRNKITRATSTCSTVERCPLVPIHIV
jgi:hypothetical protein